MAKYLSVRPVQVARLDFCVPMACGEIKDLFLQVYGEHLRGLEVFGDDDLWV